MTIKSSNLGCNLWERRLGQASYGLPEHSKPAPCYGLVPTIDPPFPFSTLLLCCSINFHTNTDSSFQSLIVRMLCLVSG